MIQTGFMTHEGLSSLISNIAMYLEVFYGGGGGVGELIATVLVTRTN